MQEAGQRRAVAGVGLARALDLDGVLAGAGQGGGVLRRGPPSAPARARVSKYQAEDWPGSTSTRLPVRSRQRAAAGPRAAPGAPGCRARPAGPAVTLAGSRNSRAVPSLRQRSPGRCGRGERMTSPPRMLNSQAMRGGRGQHRGVGALPRRWPAPTRARLAAESSPAYSSGCGTTGACGLGRALGAPGGVQRIDRRRASARRRPWRRRPSAGRGRRGCAGVGRSRSPGPRAAACSSQAGTPPSTRSRISNRPGRRPGRGPAGCSGRRRRSRPCPHDHRRPGRAGEAGGPGQPVVGVGQVFVLVLVLVRDEEAVQALLGHGLADQRKVAGAEGGVGVLSKVWRMAGI